MKKACLVMAALLISSFLLFDVHTSSASPDPILWENLNIGDNASDLLEYEDWNAIAFTTGNLIHTVTSIRMKLDKDGGLGICAISIRATGGDNFPIGSDLTYATFDGDLLSLDPEWYEISVPEYSLASNTRYAIVLRVLDNVPGSGLGVRSRIPPPYAGENWMYSVDNGSSWSWPGPPERCAMYEIWGGSEAVPWWNENWNYRMLILLEPHIENYQHRLFLDMTDNLGDNARSDFQDLRVISTENEILPIWRENKYDDENVLLWYRKLENAYSYAWLYYGNAEAESVDNGDNVFVLFDNFDGTTLNLDKWDIVVGTPSISNSIVAFENDAWETFKSDTSFSTPIILRVSAKLKGVNAALGFMPTFGDYPMVYLTDSDPVGTHRAVSGTSSAEIDALSVASDAWHTYEIQHQTNPQTFYIDDVHQVTQSDYDVSAVMPIHFGAYSAAQYFYMDWALVRKYADPEPSATLGSVERYAPNVPPTAPTELTLNAPKVGENLIAEASGSTDNDGPQSITYYYRFYNQTDTVERQAYSTDNTYVIVIGDAHDNLKVFAKAYDGENYSDELENSIIVINTPTTIPTNFTDLGMNLTDHSPTITWTEGTDNDGDTVTTFIYLGTASTPTEVESSTTDETDDLGENASHSTYPLTDGSTYYYRLRSWDGYEWSSYTTADEFRMNTPPTVPTNYTNLGLTENNTPIIEWTEGTDDEGDTITTFIYLDNEVSPTEVDGSTEDNIFTLGENASHSTYPLENGSTYYYRLRSWDGYEYSSYTTSDQFRIQVGITTLYPTDDSDVLQWMADTNRGSEVIFMVQTKINANARAFLKFDISVISLEDYILSAALQLYCYDVQYYRENVSDIVARKILDDNWSEENITWVNQPSMVGLASIPVEPAVGWMEWDITEYVDEQNEWGENVLSIALTTLMEDFDTTGRYAAFLSKEWEEEYKPRLVLELSGEEPAGFLMIITSTAGGYTIPVENEYEHPRWTEVYLQAIENGAVFEYWEKTENEVTDRIYTAEFYDILWGDTQYHAVFFAPPGMIEAMPTAFAIAISLMFGAVGFGIGKGNSTIGVMFLLLGVMMVSIFGLLPEWFFIVPLIAFVFFTLWKYSKRGETND